MGVGEAIVLAAVQGLTEFLPISSSGHLVAVRLWLGISDVEGTAFDAFLHLGTLLAVLVYFKKVWWGIGRAVVVNDEESRDKRELAAKLALATVPAAVVGYLFKDRVELMFRSFAGVAVGLIITAVVLSLIEFKRKKDSTVERASFWDAILIGLAQVVALLPGVSRSGVTIAAGVGRGLSRSQAVAFSFLMSAPIIAGAGLASLSSLAASVSLGVLVVGLAISFLSGLVAIYLLIKIVEKVTFWPFVVYLMILVGLIVF